MRRSNSRIAITLSANTIVIAVTIAWPMKRALVLEDATARRMYGQNNRGCIFGKSG